MSARSALDMPFSSRFDCMLKESFVRGVMGGGVTWELEGEGETEKRLSLDMTFRTWLFGLCGLSGLIVSERITASDCCREISVDLNSLSNIS